jgi:glycosyltransferase involved in cell wall biosynthesis
VHVIAHRWHGAPHVCEESVGGRLIVHRVALDEPIVEAERDARLPDEPSMLRGLLASSFPAQTFAWQAAHLAERLIDREGIDIIEAQEWEAPLYYLQLRRAVGLGPARQPPCVVHLHSPSEQIFAANGWDTTVADYEPAATLEAYCIERAEALLCPSQFLAEQVQRRYRIDAQRLNVVRYPAGEAKPIARADGTWASAHLCFVGRLELRKGVLELVDALERVVDRHPALACTFVGADTPFHATGGPLVGEMMRARMSSRVRRRVRFAGSLDRRGVTAALSRASVAVVPSRWENLPYACLEAMMSGLPIVASPNGGMREIMDEHSGWIAADATGPGLAAAIDRALATSAARRAEMGRAAAAAVARLCGNRAIVEQHLELKQRLLQRSAPARNVTRAARPPGPDARPSGPSGGSIAVVVLDSVPGVRLERCLAAIDAQSDSPAAVAVVSDTHDALRDGGWSATSSQPRWGQLATDPHGLAAAQQLLADIRPAAAVLFVDSRVVLAPSALADFGRALERNPDVGVVSGWTFESSPRGRVHVPPRPARSHIWRDDRLAPCVAVRREVFASEGDSVAHTRDSRLLLDEAAAERGWASLTYPGVTAAIVLSEEESTASDTTRPYSLAALAVQRLHQPLLQWFLTATAAERRALVRRAIREPRRTARRLVARAARVLA